MHGRSFIESHTTVTDRKDQDFWDQIGSILVGILVGFTLLLLASALLVWNEGRAVQTAKSLDEGFNLVVSLGTVNVASQENNGKLVHLIGPLSTVEALYDPQYDVRVHAVKLKRTVEMYQWVEHKHKFGYWKDRQTEVETPYSYTQEWRSDLIMSNSFHDEFNHKNVGEWLQSLDYHEQTRQAFDVRVGEFKLSQGLISRISEFYPLLPSYLHPTKDSRAQLYDGAFYYSTHCHVQLHPRMICLSSAEKWNHTNMNGAVRVKFQYAGISQNSPLGSPTQVSIVARQLGSELLPYKTQAGDNLEMLYYGQFSPKEIFDMEKFNKEKNQSTMLTWGIRFLGCLLVFVGVNLITGRGNWTPIVREIVIIRGSLMNLASIAMGKTLMNLTVFFGLSLSVISMALINYRPLLGFSLLTVALTPYFLSTFWSSLYTILCFLCERLQNM